MQNNEKEVNINVSLSLREAHLLSIVCGLNVTIPDAATQKSEFLQYEQKSGLEFGAIWTGTKQRSEIRRVLRMVKSQLRAVTPSSSIAKTSEALTNHPEGLI